MKEVVHKPETILKAAVIDRLITGAHIDDNAVLISEMTVANWTRRADIVLANGKLWAFEIKSDSDSLSRLPGQIDAFQKYFEKFVVVGAERFETAILAMVPDGVGVWIASIGGEIKQKVPPRQTVISRDAYISLMTAAELRKLLFANGHKIGKEAPRTFLEDAATELLLSDLASAARNAVKCRYRLRHIEFMREQRAIGTLGAIRTLRRPYQKQLLKELKPIEMECVLPEIEIPMDHPLLVHAPGGPVLKRLMS